MRTALIFALAMWVCFPSIGNAKCEEKGNHWSNHDREYAIKAGERSHRWKTIYGYDEKSYRERVWANLPIHRKVFENDLFNLSQFRGKDYEILRQMRRESKVIREIELLILKGHDVGAFDEQGNEPLHIVAMQRYRAHLVGGLKALGANMNARNNSYATPLHIAAWRCDHETVHELLVHGADVNAIDDSQTPLDMGLFCYDGMMVNFNPEPRRGYPKRIRGYMLIIY